ncbi:MAG: methylenetetrahydrofolate reductase [Chloroflexi bacterium]|nr:methylenetetrahydrofolate reductase [Chloroflexota bacterium]
MSCAGSHFQALLRAGYPVVTGEIAPPKGASRQAVERLAAGLRGYVDAVNLTDNQRGVARMSSLGAGLLCAQVGLEPIVQITCQNRNRLALQGDVLSGAALGVHNFMCLTGDHPRFGDHPDAKSVLDLNSFGLIRMLARMRAPGVFDSGAPLKDAPRLFVGAAANPAVERAARTEKKIEAGAEFIQTQPSFDLDRFRSWMADARALKLHRRAAILGGVLILRSAESATFIDANLPGVRVPAQWLERLRSAGDPAAEGIAIAAEIVQELLSIEGVAGVHLMSVGWTKAMPLVVERAGLLPRPAMAPAAVGVLV